MDILIGMGVLVVGAILMAAVMWLIKVLTPKKKVVDSNRVERSLCPVCSGDMTPKIHDKMKKRMGQVKVSARCDCGCSSDWDVSASPFILLGHRDPNKKA